MESYDVNWLLHSAKKMGRFRNSTFFALLLREILYIAVVFKHKEESCPSYQLEGIEPLLSA